MIAIVVRRAAASLQYLRDPTKPFDWGNNDANNSLDTFEVSEVGNDLGVAGYTGKVIFSCKAQTVSNTEELIPKTYHDHTIAPGSFTLVAFVRPRQFYGRIHGICNALTIGGATIGPDCTIPGNDNRWLVHDWQKHRDASPAGDDTRVAWSAGCFVLPDRDLWMLGQIFDRNGIHTGDKIPGQLFQEV